MRSRVLAPPCPVRDIKRRGQLNLALLVVTPALDRYLAGVTTETVSSLSSDPYKITGVSHGSRGNAQPPAAQRFWIVQATSTRDAAINWRIRDGQYRV